MSEQRAREFVKWLANNPDQRTKLLNTPEGQRRQLLQQAGFGDINTQEVAQVLQAGASGSLTDEELQTIAGGLQSAAVRWD